MATTVSASAISSAMQAAFASLASKADNAEEVTISEMCDVVANAVANEVNTWIGGTYDVHVHGQAGVANGTSTVLTGAGAGGTVSGATDVPYVAPEE